MLPSVSYISASLPSRIKGSLNLFENKTPTTDQPEQHWTNFWIFLYYFFFSHSVCLLAWCVGMCMCITKSTTALKNTLWFGTATPSKAPAAGSLAFRGMWEQTDTPHKAFRNKLRGLKGYSCKPFSLCFTPSHFTNLSPCLEITLPSSEMQQAPLLVFSQLNVITRVGIRPGYSPTLQ